MSTMAPDRVRFTVRDASVGVPSPAAPRVRRNLLDQLVARIPRAVLRAVPWLADRDQVVPRLALIPAGFVPVTLIALTAFGVADLRTLAVFALAPVVFVELLVLSRYRSFARIVAVALAVGIVSTLLYDAWRFSFLGLDLMQLDPIPHIGHSLGLHPAWASGYLWRYLGNGGGLAIAFFALGLRGVRTGMLYGLFVCSGLLVTLAVAPYGEQMLFPLNATTVVMATGGHLIYGAVLGGLAARRARR
jgi:hypothetical protein